MRVAYIHFNNEFAKTHFLGWTPVGLVKIYQCQLKICRTCTMTRDIFYKRKKKGGEKKVGSREQRLTGRAGFSGSVEEGPK